MCTFNDWYDKHPVEKYIRYLHDYIRGKDETLDGTDYRDFQNIEKALNLAKYLAPIIFERACVLKERNPYRSDLDCFAQAEREICDEKKVDYFAKIASEKREYSNIYGEELDKQDYCNALEKFEEEKLISKKAYSLWKEDYINSQFKSDMKIKNEEYYWNKARKLIFN